MKHVILALCLFIQATTAHSEIKGLTIVAVPVQDYDDALRWYTNVLGLEVRADTLDPSVGPDYRWLTVGVPGQLGVSFVLNKTDEAPRGPASFTLETSDCRADYATLSQRGVSFLTGIQEAPWGCYAEFRDLYGNGFLLVQSYNP